MEQKFKPWLSWMVARHTKLVSPIHLPFPKFRDNQNQSVLDPGPDVYVPGVRVSVANREEMGSRES